MAAKFQIRLDDVPAIERDRDGFVELIYRGKPPDIRHGREMNR